MNRIRRPDNAHLQKYSAIGRPTEDHWHPSKANVVTGRKYLYADLTKDKQCLQTNNCAISLSNIQLADEPTTTLDDIIEKRIPCTTRAVTPNTRLFTPVAPIVPKVYINKKRPCSATQSLELHLIKKAASTDNNSVDAVPLLEING